VTKKFVEDLTINRIVVLIVAVVVALLAATAFTFLPGRYDELAVPISTLARIIGVRGYQYERVGDTYSIAVEIPAFDPSARVFLMYNPNDAFRMASHDEWPLTWTDNQLARHRGYSLSREVGRTHWRILYFD
jgi:hypothetical protein